MNFKQFFHDYFTFNRNERKGVIVLLLIIFILAIANKMIFYFEKPKKIDEAMFDSSKQRLAKYSDSVNLELRAIQSKPINNVDEESVSRKYFPKNIKTDLKHELFKFDPNKCSDSMFLKLGFSNKQIEAIRKYISKGAVFKSKDDFFRMRIISDGQKSELSQYVEISGTSTSVVNEKVNCTPVVLDINTADSLALEQLPGIGKVLSKRIIKYRDLLGGYYSINQLNEVYGLSEVNINKIKASFLIDKSKIHKLDFNFGDLNDLSRHPYLKRNLALKILKFRSKYGKINDLMILKDSLVITNEEYERIKPYF